MKKQPTSNWALTITPPLQPGCGFLAKFPAPNPEEEFFWFSLVCYQQSETFPGRNYSRGCTPHHDAGPAPSKWRRRRQPPLRRPAPGPGGASRGSATCRRPPAEGGAEAALRAGSPGRGPGGLPHEEKEPRRKGASAGGSLRGGWHGKTPRRGDLRWDQRRGAAEEGPGCVPRRQAVPKAGQRAAVEVTDRSAD